MKSFFMNQKTSIVFVAYCLLAGFAMAACGGTATATSLLEPSITIQIAAPDPSEDVQPTAAPADFALGVTPTVSPITAEWKVKSFDCNAQGRATSVTINLDISGGVEPYKTDPVLPIHPAPGEYVSILIKSATPDEEPSKELKFQVPPASSYICKNRPDQPKPTVEKTDPPPPPPPPTEDPCVNKGGNKPPGQCNKP